MIEDANLEFEIHPAVIRGGNFIVFEILSAAGIRVGCRWERDANQYQVAAALERLAAELRKT